MSTRRPYQFHLIHLMVLTTVVAAVMATYVIFNPPSPATKSQGPVIVVTKMGYLQDPRHRCVQYAMRFGNGDEETFLDYPPFGQLDAVFVNLTDRAERIDFIDIDSPCLGIEPPRPISRAMFEVFEEVKTRVEREADLDSLRFRQSPGYPKEDIRKVPRSIVIHLKKDFRRSFDAFADPWTIPFRPEIVVYKEIPGPPWNSRQIVFLVVYSTGGVEEYHDWEPFGNVNEVYVWPRRDTADANSAYRTRKGINKVNVWPRRDTATLRGHFYNSGYPARSNTKAAIPKELCNRYARLRAFVDQKVDIASLSWRDPMKKPPLPQKSTTARMSLPERLDRPIETTNVRPGSSGF